MLDKSFPDFKVWNKKSFISARELDECDLTKKQCPQAVFGDFNGDGDEDVVLWGHDKKSALLVVVLSHRKGAASWEYEAREIFKGPLFSPPKGTCKSGNNKGIDRYLTSAPKGLAKSDCAPGTGTLKGDAFEFNDLCGGPGKFYYYDNGEFRGYPALCE